MPKLKARIIITDLEAGNAPMSTTIIIESISPLSAMTKFTGVANDMTYIRPVTDEPAGDSNANDS